MFHMYIILTHSMELWGHQKEAISRSKGLPGFALLFEMGTGKTLTIIKILEELYGLEPGKTIILCPLIVVEQWYREFEKYSPHFAQFVKPLLGTGKEKVNQFLTNKNTSRFFVMNYESLYNDDLFRELVLWKPYTLILDESHRCKDSSSKRTKRAIALSDICYNRYLLSGTPILNSPMDVFSQWRILDGGKTFGKNKFIFRATYFVDQNLGFKHQAWYFPNFKVRDGATNEINQKIAPSSMRVTKAEALNLPPLIKQTINVALGKEQARLYKEMQKSFVTALKDKNIVAEIALTKALRLMQIVTGVLKFDDGTESYIEENPRVTALWELLEDILPSKVIIWACFSGNYKQIRALLDKHEIAYAQLTGETKDKQAEISAFSNSKTCNVMLANQAAAGLGVNLVAASYMIYFSRNFSLEQELQSEARCHRGGSEIHAKITRYDLIAKDTIDELILEALSNKLKTSEDILNFIHDRMTRKG